MIFFFAIDCTTIYIYNIYIKIKIKYKIFITLFRRIILTTIKKIIKIEGWYLFINI